MIREVIEAGILAPSAKNEQKWRFTVLTGGSKNRFTTFFRSNLEVLSKKIGLAQMGSSFESCRVMETSHVLTYRLGLGSLSIANVHYLREEIMIYSSKPWGLPQPP